jgi:acyl carrier protein
MERLEVLKAIERILQDVLDNEELTITEQTAAEDVEDWDSLANVQIVVAIQKKFGKKFPAQVILSWKNVGDMINSVIGE